MKKPAIWYTAIIVPAAVPASTHAMDRSALSVSAEQARAKEDHENPP